MREKLTITLDGDLYDALDRKMRRGNGDISRFIETLLREYFFGDEMAFCIADPVVEKAPNMYLVLGRALKDLTQGDILYIAHSDVNAEDSGYTITNIERYDQPFTSVRAGHSCALTMQGKDASRLQDTTHLYSRTPDSSPSA